MNRRRTTQAGYTPVEKVDVFLWGQHLGAVALDPRLGHYVFAYTSRACKLGIEPSPLTMPLREQPYVFPNLSVDTYQRLPPMLADALPDRFGNALIDRYMAEHGITAGAVTALDRLAYMGKRGMGALEFRPARGRRPGKPSVLKLADLVVAARSAVQGELDHDDATQAALRNIIDVGTSAGGARAKAVVAWNPETRELRSGQFDAPEGYAHWLLKFDGIGEDKQLGAPGGYGRIEYAYHLMARAAGIHMSDCTLLEENGRAHFMTRRFDRGTNGEKHHLQSFCALSQVDFNLRGVNAYEQLFGAVRALGLGDAALAETYRRMAFNVAGKNCDDHAKNFAFLLPQGGAWQLAPAFDVTFAHNPDGPWTYQHLMSVNGKFDRHSTADLLAVADLYEVPGARAILREVDAAVARWREFADEAGVSKETVERIAGLQRRLM